MASHQLIETYVAGLVDRLPAHTVDELTDGLIETWRHYLAAGLSPDQAARVAIEEFGTADRITDEFVAQSPGRRAARLLLATGPIMAVCWGSSLIAGKAWTWQISRAVEAGYAIALVAVVAALLAAATSGHSYHRTRLGTVGALVVIVLDVAMLATAAAVAPTLVWPMAIAIPASIARIGLVLRSLPKALTG